MKNYIIAAAVSVLALMSASRVYASVDDPLTKASQLAQWAVGKPYSNNNRECSGESQQSGAPDGLPGGQGGTGYCSTYDCSSLATWILRQIPGITSAGVAGGPVRTTYDYWANGDRSKGPDAVLSGGRSPAGWQPCNGQSVCVGFTGWGDDGPDAPGPGHMIIRIGGTVYSASNTAGIGDGVITNYPEGAQGKVLWFVPQ